MRFFIITFQVILAASIFSQSKINITETGRSEPILFKKESLINADVVVAKNGCYVLKVSKYNLRTSMEFEMGEYTLMHFDSDLSLLKSKPLGIAFRRGVIYGSKNSEIGWMEIINDQIFIGVVERNKSKQKMEVFIHTLDPTSLEPTAAPKKVLEIDFKGIRKNSNDVGFSVSPDQSKILIYATRFNQNKNYELVAKTFDVNFNMLWQRSLSDQFERMDYLPVKQALVNNQGEAYLILRAKDHEDNRFVRMNESIQDLLPIADFKIKSLKMGFDQTNKLAIWGYYSFIGKQTNGIIHIQLKDEDKALAFDINYITLPDDFLNLYSRSDGGRSNKTYADYLMVKEIFQKDNGNWVIIGQGVYSKEKQYDKDPTNKYNYYHRNIAMVEVDTEDHIFWTNKIPSHQGLGDKNPYAFNSFASPFHFFPQADKLNIIFKDNVANYDYDGDGNIELTPHYSKFQIMIYSINEKGAMSRSVLYTKKKDKINNFYPNLGRVDSDGAIISVVQHSKTTKILKLKLSF